MNRTNRSVVAVDFCDSVDCQRLLSNVMNIAYNYIGGPATVLGLSGRCLLLLSMLGQVKQNKGYIYQMLVIGNEVIVNFCTLLYITGWFWLWQKRWFKQCYVCMVYTVQLSASVSQMWWQNLLLLTVMTVIDRLIAMRRPIFYKRRNYRRLQAVVPPLTLLISFGMCIYDCFRYVVVSLPSSYFYDLNPSYMHSVLAVVLSHCRNVLRIVCVVILIGGNVMLIVAYRRNRKQMENVLSKEDNVKRRLNERILVVFTICQCTTGIFLATGNIVYSTLMFGSSISDCLCLSDVYAAVYDAVTTGIDIVNFCCCFAISNQYRFVAQEAIAFVKYIRSKLVFKKIPHINVQFVN